MMNGKITRIIETPRLILREFRLDDAIHLFELNNDPEVLKYTGDIAFESAETAKSFIENYDQYALYGYGRWAVILKETEAFIGWCGLKYDTEYNETNIGYRLAKKYWNNGYAKEAAKASVDFGFNQLNLKTIVGRAAKENSASINILKFLGMHYFKEWNCGNLPGVYYKIEKPIL